MHPGTSQRFPPPCLTHHPVVPIAPLVQPVALHLWPPPCRAHLPVVPSALFPQPAMAHRRPPPCRTHRPARPPYTTPRVPDAQSRASGIRARSNINRTSGGQMRHTRQAAFVCAHPATLCARVCAAATPTTTARDWKRASPMANSARTEVSSAPYPVPKLELGR